MRNETRVVYNGLLAHIAKLNGVPSATESFNVTPSVQQKLETAVQESDSFLQSINMFPVNDQEGEAIGLGVNGPTASRTNTAGGNRRNPASVAALTKDAYSCKKTDFDTALPYVQLDAWAKFPDFQVRLANVIAKRQGLDRIMIGFNGTSVATATNRGTSPLLQDVNIGWLQKIRTNAPDRVIAEGATAGKVTVGAAGDYKTLDGLVFDAIQLLDPWHRKRSDLVVIVDRALLHEKQLAAVEKGAASNQEENAADEILTKGRLGGLKIEDAPFFIDGGVLITSLSNLSIYWQESARRRHIKDEPEFDRIADYQSSNDAYVIEDLGLVALVENIERV
ncbi:Capsid protein [Pseudomonas marincola]|uniref:Capsid protein n=1 Tax=Pseudomonas marincola TaxID=437900 RepID=A0A653E914_9PSED|nr:phage major capsid protein, P2 family [Pseudomonas marincola]CAE6923119.1 Capsid protein [Pseudomonas marincola]